MVTFVLVVAATAMGIDVGWQQNPEGGMEYIIRLDPETLRALSNGQELQSDVPPVVGEMRSYRIVMGTAKLPRDKPASSPGPTKIVDRKEPATLPTDLHGKPITETAVSYVNQPKKPAAPATDETPKPKVEETVSEKPARPWFPLIITLFGLFASVGANVFLGWVAIDFHRRYRKKCGSV
jgi:hypothetical protein